MPPKGIYTTIYAYYKVLRRYTDTFPCPICKFSILPKFFEKHCSKVHNFNTNKTCAWCRQYSWKSGKKKHEVNHLVNCFKDFMKPKSNLTDVQSCRLLSLEHAYPEKHFLDFMKLKSNLTDVQSCRLLSLEHAYPEKHFLDFMKPKSNLTDVQSCRLLSLEHAYPEKDFFGHEFNNLDFALIQSIWPLEVEPPPIAFQDENLNLAASYLCNYLETKDTHDWLHVMVKWVAFESFVKAMDEDYGRSRTLEFSCWCNGGRHPKAKFRQHRHMIVISSPKGRFLREVWPKVKANERPTFNFSCKVKKNIVSPLHLVNVMGYVSHRKSKCIFSTEKRGPLKMNHFYLFKTLPQCYRLALVQFWDDGVSDLLYREKFQNVSIWRVAEAPLERIDGQWKQQIKDFYGHEKGLVLPVSKHFVPTFRVTPHFFHLTNSKKLYFEMCFVDEETWFQRQVKGGNCFYDCVEESTWTPRPSDQEILNHYMPKLKKIQNLECEIDSLKEKMEIVHEKMENIEIENNSLHEKMQKIEIENSSLKEKLQTIENEYSSLKEKLQKLDPSLKEKINIQIQKISMKFNS